MKFSTIIITMCFALTALAAHATSNDVQHHHALHHVQQAQRQTIPTGATAFVAAVKVDDDSDGLSRNHEDCNRGCIDSN